MFFTLDASNPYADNPQVMASDLMALATVELDGYSFAYTGKAITPDVTMTLGDKKLKKDTDYAVAYANNVNVGTATVTITGMGDFSGSRQEQFEVTRADVYYADVQLQGESFTYDGKPHKPQVVVKMDGKTLKEGADYTVMYEPYGGIPTTQAPVDAGSYIVQIDGTGNYGGSAYVYDAFRIEEPPAPEDDSDGYDSDGDSNWYDSDGDSNWYDPNDDSGWNYSDDDDWCGSGDRDWTRLAGADRFGTMKAITLEGYDKADTVLVATGIDFADALAAAGLSGVLDAPIVTTMPGSLSVEARDAIKALGAKEAIILGGSNAVSANVEKQLKGMGLTTSRLAGSNRIDTAVRIWKRGGSSWGDTCILSKGWVAADALAAGSFAYADSAPIFLALPDGTLTPDTAKAVKSFKHVVVLGGTGGDAAIKDKTAKSLGTSWMRVAGETRYETAVALATWASGADSTATFQPVVRLSWDDCAVAYAWNYPDALVGVNVTGPKQAVTLLASTGMDGYTNGVTDSVFQHNIEVTHGYVLGGTSAISDNVKAYFEWAAL